MRRLRDERGFTLVELLVSMVITTIVFGATLSVLDVFQSNNRLDQLRNENQDMARTTLDRLARQLRNVIARTTSEGAVPGALEQAEPLAITFQTVDTASVSSGNETNAMRVRYCLNHSNAENEVLWEEVKRWTTKEPSLPSASSCPDKTSGDWDRLTQVVTHVTNLNGGHTEEQRPLFTYSSKETPEILTVNTDMFINISPTSTKLERELTSGVSLRNANRTPVAEFLATEEGNYSVRLNASASYDPDGLSLTYKWWDNGEELLTTSQQYVTKPFTKGSTQKFKLEVKNPGNLSATAERTVTIK
jgi:prepilin-type N-terminal cleavage/methylation domain-containing protein